MCQVNGADAAWGVVNYDVKPTGLLIDEVRDALQKLSGRQLTDLAAHAGVSRETLYVLRRGKTGRSVRLYTLEAVQRGIEERHAAQAQMRRKKENQETIKLSEGVPEEGALLNEVCRDLKKFGGRKLDKVAARAGVGRSTAYLLRQGKRSRAVRVHTLETLKQAMKAERTA